MCICIQANNHTYTCTSYIHTDVHTHTKPTHTVTQNYSKLADTTRHQHLLGQHRITREKESIVFSNSVTYHPPQLLTIETVTYLNTQLFSWGHDKQRTCQAAFHLLEAEQVELDGLKVSFQFGMPGSSCTRITVQLPAPDCNSKLIVQNCILKRREIGAVARVSQKSNRWQSIESRPAQPFWWCFLWLWTVYSKETG